MSTQAAAIRTSSKPTFLNVMKAGLIGGVIAAGVNSILLLLAGMFGIVLNVLAGPPPNQQPMPLSVPPVVLLSIVPAITGALLFFALTRITGKAVTIFIVIAAVFTLLTLPSIFVQPINAAGMIVLALMHIIAASVITYWLVRRA